MSGGPLHVWNKWAIQILVLLSFGLQILLFILASTRRHRPSTRLRICLRLILWLAYLMADTTAVYALGHLSLSGWLPEHELVAFWAPFLLLHLGSQDNITAYALEDNQLWPRHLLTLGVQTVGVCYVLYKHMTHEPAMVVAASLMFMVGFIKYLERTWALKRATLESIRSSIKTQPDRSVPEGSMRNQGGVPDEEELLLFAHHVLPTCMAALTDYSEDSGKVGGDWKGEHIGKVVEMELSLMYDILYTKATMIHHWYGYFLRVILVLATMVALLLFHLDGKKVGHAKIDVIITYILFGGALVLDMVSLVMAAMSTWTCDLLDNIGGWGKTLCKQLQSSRRRVKAASRRGWSGSVGQYNLFDASSRDMTKRSIRVLQVIKLDDWWKKYQYKGTSVIPGDVKELLFKKIWWTIRDEQDYMALLQEKETELHEMISVWHITTNLFLSCPEANGGDPRYVGPIKVLSNYMMFLAVARHDMLPALKLRSNCEKAGNDLQEIWSMTTASDREEGFGLLLPDFLGSWYSGSWYSSRYSSTLWPGTWLAKDLQEVVKYGRGDPLINIKETELFKRIMPVVYGLLQDGHRVHDGRLLESILDAWVRILIIASIKCSRESHAKQLSRGGELITIAWILTEHLQRGPIQ